MHRVLVVLLSAVAVATTSCCSPVARMHQAAAAPIATSPQAATVPVGADPRVGAIFLGGHALHTCTGSVLHAGGGDLILTAAHCVAAGYDASFVPGFADAADPADFWRVDEVYLDPRWVATQDPLADFAIARVSRDDGSSVEAAVGGGFTLGSDPEIGTDVRVTGYPVGVGGDPIGCTGRTSARTQGFPSLRCPGLVDGTSGSPWLSGSTVVGIVGGLDGGGCEENVSYTPPFGAAIGQLVTRAAAGGAGDDPPNAFDDDC